MNRAVLNTFANSICHYTLVVFHLGLLLRATASGMLLSNIRSSLNFVRTVSGFVF